MPRPKGCTCGTPKACKIHADDGVMAGSTPAGTTRDNPGGRAQDATRPAFESGYPAAILGVIEGGQSGAGRAEQAAGAEPASKPRRKDPAPKPRARSRRKPVAPDAPDDAALVEMLSQVFTMPAIPAALLLNCEFCRDHFIAEGPRAARELVALSIANPALRGTLESFHSAFSKLTIAGVLAGYLAKPLMHHMAPEPILTAAGPVLGVPPRPEKPKHNHAPTPAQAAAAEHASSAPEDDGPAPEDQYPGDQAAGIAAA